MTTMSASNEKADVREPSDAELVERSWDEPEAFAVLFDRYAADIHHYVARRLGTGAADDLVAETFLIAFGRRTTYDLRRSQARPWLYGIATTLVARHRRSERRLYRALARTGVDPLPEPVADLVVRRVAAQDQQRLLATALAELSRADRDVLLLVAWGGLSYEEVAEAQQVPVGTVRSRLHRARRRVRDALADAGRSITTEES
jgi:RNA polymerase sigma factor (sigma-70 family)